MARAITAWCLHTGPGSTKKAGRNKPRRWPQKVYESWRSTFVSKGPSEARSGYYFDILGAVTYLRESGAKTVSVVGGSFGGGVAARASVEAKPGDIDRLVLLAHAPIQQPERMKGRKLFITARGDRVMRLPKTREQYEKATEPKKLIILEGSAHAQHIFKTKQGERLLNEIQNFLTEP